MPRDTPSLAYRDRVKLESTLRIIEKVKKRLTDHLRAEHARCHVRAQFDNMGYVTENFDHTHDSLCKLKKFSDPLDKALKNIKEIMGR